MFPAPVRSIEVQQSANTPVPAEIGEESDTLVQILVSADHSIADSGSPLYIAAAGQIYECCVVFDGDLRQGSAYISADLDPHTLSFIGQRDGQFTTYPITLN